jgi:hypothetical protein
MEFDEITRTESLVAEEVVGAGREPGEQTGEGVSAPRL